ncbi:septal ring lytic transglycosylase RlpA family protein [Taibaiella sp. KBW10]|uniref:septal ring lytic transglycosylase RlpA family protein n=1 Tax=Taibaiella sp. KBW10 TaxID=2153357 RepID=UPI001F35E2F5|nr:septal ring lytic transglycosylase RlpA family protein [Taibaiella sp. KBW10]
MSISVVTFDLKAQGNGSNAKTGKASYYHPKFVGRKTATGEVFSNNKYTAACNQYPLGTYLRVTNTKNGKVVYVKVNDRIGHPQRIIDLTQRAASDLKYVNSGLTNVKIEVVNDDEGKRKIFAQTTGDMVDDNTL